MQTKETWGRKGMAEAAAYAGGNKNIIRAGYYDCCDDDGGACEKYCMNRKKFVSLIDSKSLLS